MQKIHFLGCYTSDAIGMLKMSRSSYCTFLLIMGIQCWCFWCAGRYVSRATFFRHGGKSAIDPPVPTEADAPTPLVSVSGDARSSSSGPNCKSHEVAEEDFGECSDECYRHYDPLNLVEASEGDGEEERADPSSMSAAELTLYLLDWMCSFKVTDRSAKSAWDMAKAMLPTGASLRSFWSVKRVLSKAEDDFCERIETCPNDCVAFWCSAANAISILNSHET
jgi:hypothetical protein